MPTPSTSYRPLGRRARDPFGIVVTSSYRLYLGDNHLLYVTNQWFAESYKRFYFRDIQALVWTRNDRRKTYNIILLLAGLCAGLLVLAVGSAADAVMVLPFTLALGCLIGVPAVVNNARGPTCTAYIKTAVHNQLLKPLGRVPLAERVFAELAPRIAAAQPGEAVPTALPDTDSVPPVIGAPPPA
jgi:hypothetical protein